MTTAIKASPDITRAAEKYLEQYGSPLVMNTYLKVTVLVLVAICAALVGARVQEPGCARRHAPDDHPDQRCRAGRSDRLPQLPISSPGGREQVLPHPMGGALFQP